MALLVDKKASVLTATPTTTYVFSKGNFTVELINVDGWEASNSSSSSSSPPKPVLIISPNVKGTYPVILFLHGFYLRNYFYKDLLELISSFGYILVAPQVFIFVY